MPERALLPGELAGRSTDLIDDKVNLDGREPGTDGASTKIALPIRMPAERARTRLRAAVGANERIDPHGASADRRLRGEVTIDAITLWVQDAHLTARRKSWNIEFRGQLDGSDGDAILSGTIEIPDEAGMRWLMQLIRVASTLPVVFAILLVVRDGITGPSAAGIVLAAAIGAVAFVGTKVMEHAGEKAAADDARALIRFIRSQLA